MTMLLVALAWTYVVVMMAIAEATAPDGTLLGAVLTLILYGALPLGIVLYVMDTPNRRRARRAREAAEGDVVARADGPVGTMAPTDPSGGGSTGTGATSPDQRGQTSGDPVAPVREPR